MKEEKHEFNELELFAHIKKRPGLYFGQPSLISLRDFLLGMSLAFNACGCDDKLRYLNAFVEWYTENEVKRQHSWWNHMIYISLGVDSYALETFFHEFEKYLSDVHNISLPEVN